MQETATSTRLICRVIIDDIRPVPWSVPLVTRSGVSLKKKPLVAWQRLIGQYVQLAVDTRRPPYDGPVVVRMVFTLAPRLGRQKVPDASNLQKSSEDALQGTAFANDNQVWDIHSTRLFGPRNRTEIRVYAAEPPSSEED